MRCDAMRCDAMRCDARGIPNAIDAMKMIRLSVGRFTSIAGKARPCVREGALLAPPGATLARLVRVSAAIVKRAMMCLMNGGRIFASVLAILVLALHAAPTESFLSSPSLLRPSSGSSTLPPPPPPQPTQLFAKSGKKKKKPKDNTICVNRQARRNYEIIDTLEAGIALVGTEVKSIRQGKMNLVDGYVRPSKNGRECELFNVHISKHSQSAEYFNHEERRPRKLLVHKEEARRLLQQTEKKGMTIVPLKAYFNDQNRVKIQIGVGRGKNVRDKRQDIKEREAKREGQRMMKSFRIS